MEENQKLTQFIDTINRSMEAEAEQMLRAAQQEADEIIAEARERCAAEEERRLAQAKRTLTAKYQKQLAQTGYQGKTTLLSQRQALLLVLFSDLRKKLAAFTDSADYLPWLKNVLAKDTPEAGSVLLLRERDMRYKDELAALLPAGCEIHADRNILLGGFSVISADGRRCYDHTLDEACSAEEQRFSRNYRFDGGDK